MYTNVRPEQAGREDSVGRHRLFLVNISIYLDKFMRAGYQQAAKMLYLSNIRTLEGNKARTASSLSPNYFKTMPMAAWTGRPHTGKQSAFLLINWRGHMKLIWKPMRRTIDR